MLRIWFNRTYATNSHVIAMLRANPDGRELHVIGTHPDPDSPVLIACDESEVEPELEPAEYVEWALQFARRHQVQVLIPRLYMAELADARERFAAIGANLACADGATVRLFHDKPRAYHAAAALGVPVPPHHVVRDSAGLHAAYQELSAIADTVCMKPTEGVGGAGYRVLTTTPPTLDAFAGQVRSRAALADVGRALDTAAAEGAPVPELLVMPYLTGPEISVDVLAARDGTVLAAIGRGRSRRRRLIVDDAPAREVAHALTRAHRVAYLSNTQVRYWQGPDDAAPRPYLLELNTRISGGLFQTALAGVNLPWAAVRVALGEDVAPLAPRFGAAFTTMSSLVPLR
ncbi:MAG: ATP-grasp domain-containing protein [Jatrophihabitantaceae bacterium]